MRIFIAIDTGAKGAVAVRLHDGTRQVYDMPVNPVGLLNILRRVAGVVPEGAVIHVGVESITGGHGAGSKATFFKQGLNYGATLAIVDLFATEMQGCYVHFAKADTWQKAVTRHKAKDAGSYAKWKSLLANIAKERYADVVTCYDSVGNLKKGLTKDACDSVLILQWLEGRFV